MPQKPDEKKFNVTRRQFLKLSGAAAAGVVVADMIGAPSVLAQGMYSEAPELAELVAAGELPAVEERLPLEPVVIEPLESIGVYGGAIRTRMVANASFQVRTMWGPEGILRVDWDSSTIVPNIASGWEYSDDGKTFILHFREGMKWSDGVPFTANDVEFWFNHVILNDTLSPSKPVELRVGGELATFEKIDDYTAALTFAAPPATFPLSLAHAFGVNIITQMPRHYLEQFHADFVDEAELTKMATDAGFETWNQLFDNKRLSTYGMPQQALEMPTLLPFKLKRPLEGNLWVADRNPYYWKVDTEGQQLPYVNEVIVTNAESADVADAIIAAGEMNYVNTGTSFTNFQLYKGNEADGNYQVRLWQTSRSSEHVLMYNHNTPDEGVRMIVNDVRFKQAMSHAIDRETIAAVLYQGFGVPTQVGVIPASKWFDPDRRSVYTEYNVDRANELLDDMGLDQRDGDGWRLRSDGERLVINVDFVTGTTNNDEIAELWKEFSEEVGVQMNLRGIDRNLLRPLIDNNEVQAGLWEADKGSDILFPILPEWTVPVNPAGSWNQWGIRWSIWADTQGADGEEPPDTIKAVQDAWFAMQQTVDEAEFLALGHQILQSNADNLWSLGTVGEVPLPVIVGSNMVNIPEVGYTAFDWLGNHQYHIEQVYFEGGVWAGEPS